MLILLISPLAVAQIAVGVETPVSTPDLETAGRTGRVAIASNGVTMLAVWTDRRSDRGAEIVAARLDTAARILDPRGIAVTNTPEISEDLPFVEFDGVAAFVVVWAAGGNTMAAKISDKGVILSGPVILGEGRPEGLTLNNRDLAVAISNATGTDISLIRSDLTLRPVTRVAGVRDLELTAIGFGFAVVWFEAEFSSGQLIVRAVRIDRRTNSVASQTITQLGKFDPPATMTIGTHDDDAVIAAASEGRMAVVRLDLDGVVTTISTSTAVIPRSMEEVVPRSNGFDLVTLIDNRPRVFRYIADAPPTENEPIAMNAGDGAGTFAERVFTVWQIDGVVMGRFAFVTEQEPAIVISRSPASQQMPALATDGTSALAVWTEDASDTSDRLMFRLLALSGAIDTSMAKPLVLGTRTMTPMQSPPAMTFNANSYFISWIDQKNGPDKPAALVMRNVNVRGVLGGTQQLSAAAHPTDRVAMADGLVVWSEQPTVATRHLRGAFVTQPLTPFVIPDLLGEPAVAHGEDGYVVVGTTSFGAVRGAFVNNDRSTRPLFESFPTVDGDSEPAVAWSPRGKYFVVWRRGADIYGRLLDRDGSPLGNNLALTTTGFHDNPRVAWDGHAFVVTWTSRTNANPLSDGDLVTMRVLLNGNPEDPVTLSATPRNDDFASLLPLGGGTMLVAYQRMVPELMNVHRVFTRVVVGAAIPVVPGKRRSVRP